MQEKLSNMFSCINGYIIVMEQEKSMWSQSCTIVLEDFAFLHMLVFSKQIVMVFGFSCPLWQRMYI